MCVPRACVWVYVCVFGGAIVDNNDLTGLGWAGMRRGKVQKWAQLERKLPLPLLLPLLCA